MNNPDAEGDRSQQMAPPTAGDSTVVSGSTAQTTPTHCSEPGSSRGPRESTLEQQFWNLWQQGRKPDPRAFLAGRSGLSASEVAGVLVIDQFERWLNGERTPLEDYLPLLPAGDDHDQAAFDLVYGEYLLREQLGEHPSDEDYRHRFPALAGLFERQLAVHRALAEEGTADSQKLSPPGRASEPASSSRQQSDKDQVPGYELLEVIARGGMGVVWKARQLSLTRMVALKIVPIQADTDSVSLERRRREAELTARMAHPHIVTVYDAGQTATAFYLAMEYVPGIDLHRLVVQQGPLAVKAACEYMRQAALGLQHAHARGLVHRDIKPSNLIVAPVKGSDIGFLKILDLGLARIPTNNHSSSSSGRSTALQVQLTQDGTFMGTPDFVAPEQASDPRCADARSDLYSLGCTFFFLLTGQTPYTGNTPLAKLLQHHMAEVPSVQATRAEVPVAVADIVRRLMAKDPEERYQTATELIQALDQAGMAPAARPPAADRRDKVRPQSPSASSPGVELLYRQGFMLVQRFTAHTDRVKGVAFAPAGPHLASVSLDRTVRLWELGADSEQWCSARHPGGLHCLAFSPQGQYLACGGEAGVISCWDTQSRSLCWRSTGQGSHVNCIVFTFAGERLLSGGHDGVLRFWDSRSGKMLEQWPAHGGAVWGVAATSEGQTALSGGQDRALRMWNLQTGESLQVFPEQPMLVTALALSPDGRLALTGGVDGNLHLWDLSEPRKIRVLEGHTGRVTGLTFDPSGRLAASCSWDGCVRLWDVSTGVQRHCFREHTHWVSGVAWSPDGRHLASAGVDRSVCVYAAGMLEKK